MLSRLNQIHTQTSCSEQSTDDICPMCQNTGWYSYYDADGIFWSEECKCGIRQREIMNNVLRFASIPDAFKNVSLDSFNTDAYTSEESRKRATLALKCVNYWLDNFNDFKSRGIGLYMYSKTKGSGKTRMAVSIANELIHEKGCQVKFCTSLQILNEIKATWDNANESESKLLNDLSATEILIIDDFGTENSEKSWINEKFYQVINNRYIEKKVTIFTSNEALELLRYDDRITNRIKECVFQIPFPEESVRDIIAKDNFRELVNGLKNSK